MRLPTPAVVRDEIGPAFDPKEIFGVAALVLQVDGIRREAWSDATELSVKLFESYPRGQVPPPDVLSATASHKIIDDAEKTETRRCSTCVIRPGFSPCAVCVGTGAGPGEQAFDRCYACSGEGFLPCSACDGTTRVVACTIRYVNDAPIRVRRTHVPAIHPSIHPFVEAKIHCDAVWPEDHAFDPEPSLVASAYRGASTIRNVDAIEGFFFGDALGWCLAAREEVTTGLVRFTAKTFAVPILWTVTGNHHTAYFYDESGTLQVVQG
jgi:hypothetical protein